VPTPERQKALLTLLADEDDRVYQAIRTELLAAGEKSAGWLREHTLHPDPAIRRRVLEFLNEFDAERNDNAFILFCLSAGENLDLEEGVWRFVHTAYPDANVLAYQAQLDQWAEAIRENFHDTPTGADKLRAINEFLYGELAFRGNSDALSDPQASYLNRVIDRRLGIPISLCCVYMFVARRLGMAMSGIGMPGHFLCRYQTPLEEHFVDAFHGGLLMSRAEARKRLAHYNLENDDRLLMPISTRRTLQRMVSNVHLVYKERNDEAAAERLQRHLFALAR
jgi:regulator of sirC expression with transglutaminase-like and TPR domain